MLSGWTKSITTLFRDQHRPVGKGLAQLSHRPKDLVGLMRGQLSQPRKLWSERKKQAWDGVRMWRRGYEFTEENPSEMTMTRLVGILDDLLFGSSLGSSIRFQWKWFSLPSHADQIIFGATTTAFDSSVNGYIADVWMYPEPHPPLGYSAGDFETVLFETLLHEMCHAYLGLYACRGL
ncbi:hypothetical protein LTR86_008677 [Recurvomyces mirabilis]|nr:hypothetical protein LTR86_008677 [Recurvomyces mirabilis]